jgi:ReqiPepy6 Gp37-like protein
MPLSFPQYQINVCDPFGLPLGDATKFVSLKYSRTVNTPSTLVLTLPGQFDSSLLRYPDGRIEVWRRAAPGYPLVLETETTWLIKEPAWERDDQGNQTIVIEADTPLSILQEPGRFHDYPSDPNGYSPLQDPCDALCQTIARLNIGSLATSDRTLAPYITVAPQTRAGPTVKKELAWRSVLKSMQELANASAQGGVYLAFDIVAPTADTLQYRTYTGWRGMDHRFPNGINPVIIGPEFGNMGACRLSKNYRGEITYVKTGGRGPTTSRLLGEAIDQTRVGASPFGRREKFVEATQYTTVTGLDNEAEAAVRGGRPVQTFRGKLLSVPGCLYGIHWAWGDYVTVQAFGQSFDCRIDAITVTVANGKETIDAWLRSDTVS